MEKHQQTERHLIEEIAQMSNPDRVKSTPKSKYNCDICKQVSFCLDSGLKKLQFTRTTAVHCKSRSCKLCPVIFNRSDGRRHLSTGQHNSFDLVTLDLTDPQNFEGRPISYRLYAASPKDFGKNWKSDFHPIFLGEGRGSNPAQFYIFLFSAY